MTRPDNISRKDVNFLMHIEEEDNKIMVDMTVKCDECDMSCQWEQMVSHIDYIGGEWSHEDENMAGCKCDAGDVKIVSVKIGGVEVIE